MAKLRHLLPSSHVLWSSVGTLVSLFISMACGGMVPKVVPGVYGGVVAPPSPDKFVKATGTRFTLGGKLWYFQGECFHLSSFNGTLGPCRLGPCITLMIDASSHTHG